MRSAIAVILRRYLASLLKQRWRPGAVENRRWRLLRPVHPHHQNELGSRRGQPICLRSVRWLFVREVEIKRPVGIECRIIAQAHRELIERIWIEVVLAIVHRDRPEAIDRWPFTFSEMDDVG